MAVHTLHKTQIIRASMADAWAFFSNPRNLARITPPEMNFETMTPDLPQQIHAGLMIAHRVRALPGITLTWLSEITLVEYGVRFIDQQRSGPFSVWHHEHGLRDLGEGRVEVSDRVTYVLPFTPVGDLAHAFVVRPQLERIFNYREKVLNEIWPSAPAA